MRNVVAFWMWAAVAGPLTTGVALGQTDSFEGFPDLTEHRFAIDNYRGVAIGSVTFVGMGGAAIAAARGADGTEANVAAPAVRRATSSSTWDWDWNVAVFSPRVGADFDNNGVPTSYDTVPLVLVGSLVGQYRNWAVAYTFDGTTYEINTDYLAGGPSEPVIWSVAPTFAVGRLVVARSFADELLTVGIALRTTNFRLGAITCEPDALECPSETTLIDSSGSAVEAGVIMRPKKGNYRLGAVVALPAKLGAFGKFACFAPQDCAGYIMPDQVTTPWRTGVGVAWRLAPTEWNDKVAGRWRDEPALLLAADLVVTGAVSDGSGVEAYVAKKLQPSGRRTVLSIRFGAEYEWLPGRLRARGGSYWEPGRFETSAGEVVPGRGHLTLGLDYRLFQFCLFRQRYRARLSLTSDTARGYFNGGVSLGLWK